MEFPGDCPLLRIGELSRRLGVSDHVLRAWENRYGLLQPVRSPGGFRLYSEADEWRIRRMQAYLADGLSAAEAARAALSGDASTPPGRPAGPPLAASAEDGLSAALRQALDAFDESAAQAVLDRLLADLSVPAVLRDVVLPDLAELASAGTARDGQRGHGAFRHCHPRPARGAGPWLGERARAAGPARLPARRAARYGADGFRHRAAPQRLADRLSRATLRSRIWSGPRRLAS